jgi:uncharacterized repeat protein (TIGR01451 family)
MKTIKNTIMFVPVTGGAMFKTPRILTACMRKILLTIGVGLALSGVATFSSHAAGTVTLRGHVPAVVSQLQAEGLLPATTNLNLAIGLPLKNREELANLLQQIYDPTSANYHHYLTPEEFTGRFGPSQEDYQNVINFANANGLIVTATHPNRAVLDVSGSAAAVGKAFQVTMRVYQHPTEKRTFFAPDVEPSVPVGLSIQDISGLNNYSMPRPMLHRVPSGAMSPALGSGPLGGYIGNDFRQAYVPGVSLRGSGQIVGLLQFDGYYSSDILNYESIAGLTNVPLQNVLLDGFSGVPGPNNDEVCLDIEMVISMAPALGKVVVFEAGPSGQFNDILSSMVSSNQIKQFSSSWGWTGSPNTTTHQLFQQMAMQGQSFFQASGDGDAWVNPIWEPGDDPDITIVGGTTLAMNGFGASYASETVWNWGYTGTPWAPNGDGYIGSGGGISADYAIPSWQTNINMAIPHGSTTMRNIPDVALTADNVFVVYGGGSQGAFGGTSCAAPLWAGFTALVNQQATNTSHAPVGFINPAIYAIASGTNYTACFHDTTTGSNTWSGSPTLFYAVSGYDLCTGLGTPNGTNLINALVEAGGGTNTNTVTFISAPLPPYGTNLAALNGGNPNGTWELFVLDDAPANDGAITNGWILTLTTASPVGAAAGLALSMTAPAGSVVISNTFDYNIMVTNYGPSSSTNVIVLDNLPSGIEFVLATNYTQGSVSHSGSDVTWNVGILSNSGAQLTLTVRPDIAGNNIRNDATVSSDTPDPNPDDNSAFAIVNVTQMLLSRFLENPDGTFQFTVTGMDGQPNIIDASTNLVHWDPVWTNYTSPFPYTDPNATNYPYRFYRVRVP